MATLNYKQIINLATQGFKNIQNAIYNLSDDRPSEITQVTSGTSGGAETHTGNVTPDTMATAIGKLATIKISNTTTNDVTTNNGYISGQVKYNGSNITVNPSRNGTTVSYEQTLTGYYAGVKISGSLNLGTGKVTINGGALSASNLDGSGEITSAFKPTDIVLKANATDTSSYSYAKISRSAVQPTITTNGYISSPVSSSNIANNAGSTDSAYYVKIPNASFSKTNPKANLNVDVTQAEFIGSTNQNTSGLNVIEAEEPGAGVAYYKILSTPSLTVASNGSVKASTAGYAPQNAGKTDVSITTNTVTSVPRYIMKSSLDRSTLTWANQTATITRGYYPTARTVTLSMDSAAASTTNTVASETTKYYNGSNSLNVSTEILIPSSNTPTGRYYTLKTNSTVSGSITTAGYLSDVSQMGLNNGSVTKYLPELQGTISFSSGTTTKLGYTQDSSTGTLLSKLDNGSSSNSGSGVVTTAPSGKVEGTDYWRIQAITGSTSENLNVTASANITRNGYLEADNIRNGLLSNVTKIVTPSGKAEGNYLFYVTLPTFTFSVAGTTTLSCGSPTISLNAASNGTNSVNVNGSAATTTKPTTGYFVAVQSAALANSVKQNLVPTATTATGGYTPKTKTFQSSTQTQISATYDASAVTYIPVTSGVAKNGYVITSGWMPQNTQIYTLSYDSTEECVDFVFNE